MFIKKSFLFCFEGCNLTLWAYVGNGAEIPILINWNSVSDEKFLLQKVTQQTTIFFEIVCEQKKKWWIRVKITTENLFIFITINDLFIH